MKKYMTIPNKIRFFITGVTAIIALSVGAMDLSDLSIIDNDTNNVVVSAEVSNIGGIYSMIMLQATLTNGLSTLYFQPDEEISAGTWVSTNWTPYFRGVYQVTVTGVEISQFGNPTLTNISILHTVSTNRQLSGVINSIKYQPSGETNFVDVDHDKVSLFCTGPMPDLGGGMGVGCDLLNNTVDVFSEEHDEDVSPYDDISEHYPLGTKFRFSINLHARPDTFMGMGHIQQYIWTCDDTNSPSGPGELVLDIASCSPWRSVATNPVGAHVGFGPVFIPEGLVDVEGSIMCTTAHYMDVQPSFVDTNRVGLTIDGHAGTTNYLSGFIPDSMLERWAVTNVDDQIAGFVNGAMVASSLTDMTRIEGGTNVVYDWNGDGLGDSGYLVQFIFEYAATSGVSAKLSDNAVLAQIGVKSVSTPIGDFDGDGKADLAVYQESTGYWFILLSSTGELSYNKLGEAGYTPAPADFDGDGKTDLAVFHEASGYWYYILSSSGSLGYTKLGETGYAPVPADFDGDGKADLAVYNETTGYWYYILSSSGSLGYTKLGETGYAPVPADFDGDSKADLAVYNETTGWWYYILSSSGLLGYSKLGESGYAPVPADYDGDGKADLAVYNETTGWWYYILSSSGALGYAKLGETGYDPVPGDYDGDSKTDLTVYQEASGYWFLIHSSSGSLTYQKLGEPGYRPVR